MENSKIAEEHIAGIFKEYTTPSRVLRSFTNLSNTVIQTALSGQNKFIFELLQNADDAYDERLSTIEIKFILDGSYLIVHHNGKGFDYNDVERICDYASQIEEVKANDLSKTGYKGLGFKSLFNLSDCIYICSNRYSFRFDKNYWPDPDSKPWQVIPIVCADNELPLQDKYTHTQKVNIILKVNNVKLLEGQLKELVGQPDLLLFLHRINKLTIYLDGKEFCIERQVECFGNFNKISFLKNRVVTSSWLTRTFQQSVPSVVRKLIQGASQFVYPEKIKRANEVTFTFAIKCKESYEEIITIKGLCFSTLPTQLHLSLPYHLNSSFILNLDRTQLHENEWNCFLIRLVGCLQLHLLKDLAGVEHLRNYVIALLVRKIKHQFSNFCTTFLNSYESAKKEISWLPCYEKSSLLKLGEAWTDDINFFVQKFQNIKDNRIIPYLIDYDVKNQCSLSSKDEAQHFTFKKLYELFTKNYRNQLNDSSYLKFISYLYKNVKPHSSDFDDLESLPFLIAKDRKFIPPSKAILEDDKNPIPEFLMLNPVTVDNDCLPANDQEDIKYWLTQLGANYLTTPLQILKKSVFAWIDNNSLNQKITLSNHDKIIKFMAENSGSFSGHEYDKLRQKFIVLTKANRFKSARLCYVPDATTIEELSNVISDNDKISSMYDSCRREFFIQMGVHDRLDPIDVLRKSILAWIDNGIIKSKMTLWNYNPIVKFLAMSYPSMQWLLTQDEKSKLKKMPVLTCNDTLREAELCFFKEAIPKCKELELVISLNELVYTEDFSENVVEFYKKIGVSSSISSSEVLQRSVLKWIQEDQITEKITKNNHWQILSFIAENWSSFKEQKELLKKFPILTNNDSFKAAFRCYFPTNKKFFYPAVEIPGLDKVFASDDFISDSYFTSEEKIGGTPFPFFSNLRVQHLNFESIYEKYSNHLSQPENVKWFFSELTNHWMRYKNSTKDILLSYLVNKFQSSSCLLAKNGLLYSSTSLYSSKFGEISNVDLDSVPILDCDPLDIGLEKHLGFKNQLELPLIVKLLETVNKNIEMGNSAFFKAILEQLKNKPKKDVENCQLCLLSEANKMVPAKDLYYFKEEEATCKLQSCYLKRITDMTHKDTLELAKLCGVNIVEFNQKIQEVDTKEDATLKEFYINRLPYIAFQESKQKNLNLSISQELKSLYEKICSVKLFECKEIHLLYPFGEPVNVQRHFDKLTLYVTREWIKHRSKIHDHLSFEFGFLTDIKDIIDMDPFDQSDVKAFLENLSEEDCSMLKTIEEEFLKISRKGKTEQPLVPQPVPSNFGKEQHLDMSLSKLNEFPISVNLEVDNFQNETVRQVDNFKDEDVHQADNFVNETVGQVDNFQNETVRQIDNFQNETVRRVDNFQNEIVRQVDNFQNETVRRVDNFQNETVTQIHYESRNTTKRRYDEFRCKTSVQTTEIVLNSAVTGGSPVRVYDNDTSHLKMLGKNYVFSYLQDYYKNKHPDSKFNLQDELFSIGEGSNLIEITLLKKGHYSFDILMKKCGEIDEIIEIEMNSLEDSDTFQLSCYEFLDRIGRLHTEFYQHKERYHIYYIFCTNNFSMLSDELQNPVLFKISPLKI